MNTKLTLLVLMLFPLMAFAQLDGYEFSQSTASYQELANGIQLNDADTPWDDEEYTINPGFTFKIFDQDYSALTLEANGTLYSTFANGDSTVYLSVFGDLDLGADLIDRGVLIGTSISPIRYQVDGVTGNRILKIEWKNAGFYEELELTITLNDFVNVQCWIHEADGCIEYHMGPTVAAATSYYGADGPVIGVGKFDNFTEFFDWGYYLINQPATPNVINEFEPLTGTPSDGSVYSFCPSPIVVSNKELLTESASLSIMPNPVNDILNLQLKEAKLISLAVYDMKGQLVLSPTLNTSSSFSVADLSSGLYLLKVETEEGILSRKFVKQ